MPRLPVFISLALWLLILGLSIALSVLAALHDTLPGDTGTTSWLQDRPFPGQQLSDLVRSITFTELLLGAGAALALVLWFRGYRAEALAFAAGLIILPLLQSGIKEIADRPRPAPGLVELRAGFSSPSFPAGHVMSPTYFYGFLLYVAATFRLPEQARAVLAVLSLAVLALTGPVNVWLGVHWPSDALGGYAWGIVLLLPVLAAIPWLRPRV